MVKATEVEPRELALAVVPGSAGSRGGGPSRKVYRDADSNVSYIIQFPREQIFKVPAPLPEDTDLRRGVIQKKIRSRETRRCLVVSYVVLFVLVVFLVSYLIVWPYLPNYSVDGVLIQGIDPASNATQSPSITINLLVMNLNRVISYVSHESGGSMTISAGGGGGGVELGGGTLPEYKQNRLSTKEIQVNTTSSGVALPEPALATEQRLGAGVAMELRLWDPVSFKLGFLWSWTITAKATCSFTVDKITLDPKLVSSSPCRTSMEFYH